MFSSESRDPTYYSKKSKHVDEKEEIAPKRPTCVAGGTKGKEETVFVKHHVPPGSSGATGSRSQGGQTLMLYESTLTKKYPHQDEKLKLAQIMYA